MRSAELVQNDLFFEKLVGSHSTLGSVKLERKGNDGERRMIELLPLGLVVEASLVSQGSCSRM